MREIVLNKGFAALVDDEDFEFLNKFNWFVIRGYAVRHIRNTDGATTSQSMHREIMDCVSRDGKNVDHINGNRLDNRRVNLRFATSQHNCWNSANKKNSKSRFKGVGWSHDRWAVNIRADGKQIYIGRFKSEIEAAYYYDLASMKYHGEFGRRNFLPLVQ